MKLKYLLKYKVPLFLLLFFILEALPALGQAPGALFIGAATTDITPPLPAAADGQMRIRVAETVETPLTANVLVLESRATGSSGSRTVFVSCDLVTIPTELRDLVRQSVARRVPDLDPKKIILNATHTHTAGVVRDGWYTIPEGVTQVKDYQAFIADRVADAILKAWNNRVRGSVSWGLGHAKVAYNRRAAYADGSARMYGATNVPEFRKIEGYEDQSVNSLFFWDDSGKLIAVCINVASPAQVVESRSAINADYWHPVREFMKAEFGEQLVVLGWIGAAGDQTPRPMYSNQAEYRMVALRHGDDQEDASGKAEFRTDEYLDEIGRRIFNSVVDIYGVVKDDRHQELVVDHKVAELELPMRLVLEEEYEYSKKMRDEDLNDPERRIPFSRRIAWYQEVLDRYEAQKNNAQPIYPVEIHVLRLGDVAISTNPFELFTEFGIQMKARSNALQTFVIQLVGAGTYVPTREAVAGGHYSAVVQSNRVGPEGGQILVDRTVEMINGLF